MIRSLRIRGLKGQEKDISFNLKKYTFVLGSNATGKSSFMTGIRSAMLGIVPENAIHCGSKDMVAQVELSDGTQLRTVAFTDKPTKHFLNGKSEAKKTVNEARKRVCKMDPDVADILTREGQYALDLKPEEFSRLMGEFISSVDTEKVISALALNPEAEAKFRKMYADTQISFDNIESLYKVLSEEQRDLKKTIAAEEQSAAFLKGTSSGAPKDTLLKQRVLLQGKLDALNKEDAKAKEGERILEERKQKSEEIQKLEDELKACTDTVPEGTKEKITAFLINANKLLSEEKMNEGTFARNVERDTNILDQLESSICPISKKLICTTDKTGVRAELEASIEENNKMLELSRGKIKSLELSIEQANGELEKCRKAEEAQREKIAKLEKLKLLKANLPPLLPAPRRVDPLDITALENQIDALNKDILNAENVEKADKLLADAAEKSKDLETLQTLRETFAPKGAAYNVILAAVCGTLNNNVNKTAKDLGFDREYEFRVDNGMTMYGKRTGEPEMFPVKNSSTGERFIAHLLLMTMINALNGAPFIIIDNLDCLDETNVQKVLRLVMSPGYETRFENVILSGVNHKDFCEVVNALSATRADVEVINLPVAAAAGAASVA